MRATVLASASLILAIQARAGDTISVASAVEAPMPARDSAAIPVRDSAIAQAAVAKDSVQPAAVVAAPGPKPAPAEVAAPTSPIRCPRANPPRKPEAEEPMCPRRSEGTPCCPMVDPGAFGVGFRLLGETSDIVASLSLPRHLQLQARAGWSYERSRGKPEKVVSNYELQDFYVGDTMSTDQSYSGTGRSGSERMRGEVAAFLVLDLPTDRGLDLVLGVGPSWTYDRSTATSQVRGTTADSLDVGNWSHRTDRTEGWGAGLLLGFRWWLVPGRLALAGEMRTGMEWATSRGRAQDSSIQINSYRVPDEYPQRRTIETSHDTPTSSDDFRWKSRSAALGLDVFF